MSDTVESRPGRIRVGIGGWNYEPWRETFYPPGVKSSQELEYASRQVTAIEINSTFYRLQNAAVFAKWRDATPDDFVFCIKAPRFIVQRKTLAGTKTSIDRFIDSGVVELKHKLGAILWQLDPNHQLEVDDLRKFFDSLPKKLDSLMLRHAINVRHESFKNVVFIELAREYRVAIVFEDDHKHPAIADLTADFIYARLRRSVSSEPTGYAAQSLKQWAERASLWSVGNAPDDLPYVAQSKSASPHTIRDVFIFFINGAKERAPAAAQTLLAELAR